MPQVKRGEAAVGGQADQPAKGAVKATNEALAAIPQVEDVLAGMQGQSPSAAPGTPQMPTAPISVKTSPRTGNAPPKLSDDDSLAFGPTARPQESVTMGGNRGNPQAVPPEVFDNLQGLADAAKDPSAPPQLKQLARILATFLES